MTVSVSTQQNLPVLFVLRLNSALVHSLKTGQWQPQGMPAVCKLLAFLEQQGQPFDVALVDKNQEFVTNEVKVVQFPEFNGKFFVLPCLPAMKPIRFLRRLGRFREFAGDLQQIQWCQQHLRKNDYGLVYVDRTNLIVGAYLAWFHKVRVFLRLHGVISFYDYYAKPLNRLLSPAHFLSFSAPYDQILCTQDGTAGDPFISRYKNSKVPHSVLLNGVHLGESDPTATERLRKHHGIQKGMPVILFTGRLESSKGANEFLDVILRLASTTSHFKAIMVGGGSLESSLREKLRNAGAEEQVIMTGALAHSEMSSYYNLADIYVSLNIHGNLSNCVLESVASGVSLITLGPGPYHRDDSTFTLLGDRAIYIDRNHVQRELLETLTELLNQPEKVQSMKTSLRQWALSNMSSWEERLQTEFDLIRRLAV